MSSSIKTSGLEFTDSTDREDNNATLRHRADDAADTSADKKTNVNETAVETPFTSSNVNEASPDDDVEYIKGSPVIKNGARRDVCRLPLKPEADKLDRIRCF